MGCFEGRLDVSYGGKDMFTGGDVFGAGRALRAVTTGERRKREMRNNRPILLVEDDVVDHMLVQRALADLKISNKLNIATSAEAALNHLRDDGTVRPGIIILDLNMPRVSGLDLLRVLKKDDDLRRIPVVVLTTSREEADKQESFKLGAAGYLIKPVEYPAFVDVIRTLAAYWTMSELPT